MKFSEYKYIRPNVDEIKNQYRLLIEKFKHAENAEEQFEIIKTINKLSGNIDTMYNLVTIRHSINTQDEFYDKENEYMDKASPIFQGLTVDFYKILVNSKFKEKLKKRFLSSTLQLQNFQSKLFRMKY